MSAHTIDDVPVSDGARRPLLRTSPNVTSSLRRTPSDVCFTIRPSAADTFEFLEHTSRTGLFVKPLVLDLLAELGLTVDDVGVRFG